jgi:RNA polymerase sigma factor (TIGR02999 family)
MTTSRRTELTQLLLNMRSERGSPADAGGRVFALVYNELHRMAGDLMRHEREGHTLQATALVHETYCRLVDQSRIDWKNRAHFFGIAARAMRQILVDHAREKLAAKRGGSWQRVTLDENLGIVARDEQELLEFHEVLERLSEMDKRMGEVVELRVFGGLTAEETAHVLGVSRRTVQEDWRVAKMWLARELTKGEEL